jgi:hypothetical protein
VSTLWRLSLTPVALYETACGNPECAAQTTADLLLLIDSKNNARKSCDTERYEAGNDPTFNRPNLLEYCMEQRLGIYFVCACTRARACVCESRYVFRCTELPTGTVYVKVSCETDFDCPYTSCNVPRRECILPDSDEPLVQVDPDMRILFSNAYNTK